MNRSEKILYWLTGLGLSIGLLVVLRLLQLPYFLYYSRTADTVLISASFDVYFLVMASLCVPGRLVHLIQIQKKRVTRQLLFLTADSAVWLIAVGLIAYSKYAVLLLYVSVLLSSIEISANRSSERSTIIAYMLTGAVTIIALVEAAPIYYWASSAANPYAPYGGPSYVLETNLTYSIFFLAPAILFALLTSWFWVPILSRTFHAKRRVEDWIKMQKITIDKRLLIASLDLFAIVAVLIFTFLYFAGQQWIVGVDSYINYLNPLSTMRTLPPSQALVTSIKLFHGIYVGILYLATVATGLNPFFIVKYAPLLLAFATSSLVFLVFLKAGWDFRLALLSSLCSLLWLPTTIGFYAGTQANWFALLLWMLFLMVFLANKTWTTGSFVIQSATSLAILLVHPWTWGVFLATILITSLLSARARWRRKAFMGLFSSLALALPVGAFAFYFTGLHTDMSRAIILYAYPILHPDILLLFGGAMVEMLRNWSSYFSPVLLLVALIGAYSLRSRFGVSKTYLLAWIITWCVGSILAAPLDFAVGADPVSSDTELWRMMYLSPLPILLALGIENCLVRLRRLKPFDVEETALTQREVAVVMVIVGLCGAGLFIFVDPVVRMLMVLAAVSVMILLTSQFPVAHIVRIMILAVLLLLVVNAALRSLSPLLLDPHNVLGSWSG